MRIARISASAVALFCLALAPAYAQKGKGGGPAATTHGPTASTHGPVATHGHPKTATATTTTAAQAHGNPHTATTTASTATTSKGGKHAAASTVSGTTGTTTSTVTNPATTTTSTTVSNPIAQKLQDKPLGARIEKMLPTGMTLDKASSGFRNQGQFIAAVHVSRNLGIPFADLKATMLGLPLQGTTTTTALRPMSLGQAIQRLRPSANATTEAAHAETQARTDLSTTTTATATTTASSRLGTAKTSKKKPE